MNDRDYDCIECNKKYKYYRSLWNHNRIKHNGKKTLSCRSNIIPKYKCNNCPKLYKHKQSRYNHEIKCTELTLPTFNLSIFFRCIQYFKFSDIWFLYWLFSKKDGHKDNVHRNEFCLLDSKIITIDPDILISQRWNNM